MSFNVGENVGPYRITEQLGQGGMATVYKAYHAALDRYVALKVLHPAFKEDQTFTARFQREARVVAKLEHPNIVPVYDFAEHEGRPYLVMKFIEGDTLKAQLMQGPLNAKQISQVVDSVGSALGYAHKQGILHRDIKPSNVLIANDGVMYLADFGLARIAQAGESTMSSDSIMGTPQYISPEQAMGKKDLDAGTDIYSFAVMLYEMVVGQVPYSADTPFSIIHDHIYTPLPMPRSVNPNVPEEVERVLLKALAKERADRYATVEDLIAAFKSAWDKAGIPMQGTSIAMSTSALKAGGVSVPAAPTTTPEAPKKKRPVWKYVAGAVGVLLVCCIAFFLIRIFVGPREGRLRLFGNGNNQPAPTQPAPMASQPVPPVPPPTHPPPPTPQGQPPQGQPPQGQPQTSPEIQAAQEAVGKDPENPNAHLDLSLAYWDAGQQQPAYDELKRMTDILNNDKSNNKEFFTRAADEFYARQAWIPSTAMHMNLLRILRNGQGQPPKEIMDRYHESLYKAAEISNMPEFPLLEKLKEADNAMWLIAQARNSLYNGNAKKARSLLDEANASRPGMLETKLLEGEILFKEGKAPEAKKTFDTIRSDPNAPQWIRALADSLFVKIP